jgi:hypothetical protein
MMRNCCSRSGGVGATWPGFHHSDHAEQLRHRLAIAFRKEFGDAVMPVMKDPRVCRLLLLWLPIFRDMGAEPHVVMLIRNPLEVAASLRDRDGMSQRHALLLWLRHFLDAERDTRDLPRCFVSYEQVMDNWRAVVGRIGSELNLNLRPQSPQTDVEISKFVSAGLRRNHIPIEELIALADVPAMVKQVYHWACRACQHSQSEPAILDEAFAAAAAHD